jgi:short subunit dehydrogenase-like uncharacterized protein
MQVASSIFTSKRHLYDIVVHGATGFTGTLIVRYLLECTETALDGDKTLKWAIAGRNASKLTELKKKLIQEFTGYIDANLIDAIPTIIVDITDESTVQAMVQEAKVILNAVGPYTLYGRPIVKACAENGTHYCDLTGEVEWVKEMRTEFQTTAESSGAIILNFCGLETAPPDILTYQLVNYVRKSLNEEIKRVNLYFTKFRAEGSGGTILSIITAINQNSKSKQGSIKSSISGENPFILTDTETENRMLEANLVKPNQSKLMVSYVPELQQYSSFAFGTRIDQPVIHYTNYLLSKRNKGYGNLFVYQERRAQSSYLKSWLNFFGLLFGFLLLKWMWTQALLYKLKLLPKPGEGASMESMKKGQAEIRAFAYTSNEGPACAEARMHIPEDPGYLWTSKCISEIAIALAKEEYDVKTGGFYTTGSILSDALWQRLETKKLAALKLTST